MAASMYEHSVWLLKRLVLGLFVSSCVHPATLIPYLCGACFITVRSSHPHLMYLRAHTSNPVPCRVVEQQIEAGLKPYAHAKSLGQQQLVKLQVRQHLSQQLCHLRVSQL